MHELVRSLHCRSGLGTKLISKLRLEILVQTVAAMQDATLANTNSKLSTEGQDVSSVEFNQLESGQKES